MKSAIASEVRKEQAPAQEVKCATSLHFSAPLL